MDFQFPAECSKVNSLPIQRTYFRVLIKRKRLIQKSDETGSIDKFKITAHHRIIIKGKYDPPAQLEIFQFSVPRAQFSDLFIAGKAPLPVAFLETAVIISAEYAACPQIICVRMLIPASRHIVFLLIVAS